MADTPLRPDPAFDVNSPPRVAGSSSLWPVVAGILGALGLGALVFLQLSANRTRVETARLTDPAPNAAPISSANLPPAPDVSALAAPEPASTPEPQPPVELAPPPPPPPPPPGPTQAELDRARAPALIIDLGEYQKPDQAPSAPVQGGLADPRALAAAAGAGASGNQNADERFAERLGVGDVSKPARAHANINLAATVVEGSIIPAVLETALNSDLPGYARAVVSRDVRSFDGSEVLIPRGSRLIGQYKSGVALGQSRAFVIWTRLIRPDGAAVDLASPGTDALGRGGLTGSVDTHFFQRFGGAILLSLLNLGVGALTDASDTAIVIAATRAGGDTFGADVAKTSQISPTVKVPQGTPVRVFVSQDLDFSAVGPAKAAGAAN